MEVKERKMTDEHKAALATGRRNSKIVNNYLTVLDSEKPKRGRKRTNESIHARLAKIDEELLSASMVHRLTLLGERETLNRELEKLSDNDKIAELEDQFVQIAKGFGEKNGIPRNLWKAFGVNDAVLDKAGISR